MFKKCTCINSSRLLHCSNRLPSDLGGKIVVRKIVRKIVIFLFTPCVYCWSACTLFHILLNLEPRLMSKFIWNVAGLMAEGKETMWDHRLLRGELLPLAFHHQSKSYSQVCCSGEGKYSSLTGKNSTCLEQ